MKIIITIILLFTISCEGNIEGKKKREEAILFALSLPLLFSFEPEPSRGGPPNPCPAFSKFTNLKSIDNYFNGSFFFSDLSSPTLNTWWQLSCEPNFYQINFNDNLKLNSMSVYVKKKEGQPGYEYTGIRLYFKDNTFKDYTMNFNGDPDTFTEFTAGEYRFVAVR